MTTTLVLLVVVVAVVALRDRLLLLPLAPRGAPDLGGVDDDGHRLEDVDAGRLGRVV